MIADKAAADPRCNKMDDFCLVFAEMIVKECAKSVVDFYKEDEFTCYSAAEEIKNHFGVK